MDMNVRFESIAVQNVTAIDNHTTYPGLMAEKPNAVKHMNLHFEVS